MDIVFQDIKLEHKELIEYYLKKKTYRSCELVFSNIFLWCRFYPTKYAIVEEALVFLGVSKEKGMSITFPAGDEPQVKRALDVMMEYFREQQAPFRMHLVQEQEFALLEQWYPGRFEDRKSVV